MEKSQNIKPLTSKAIESMRAKDADKSDVAEYKGLRVSCGISGIKTFYYRYTSPLTGKLSQIKIGIFPNISLAQAREKVAELKLIRAQGRCPAIDKGQPIQQKYLTENAWHLRRKGEMLDIPNWTPHDLRRTVRTGLSKLRCPNEVAEAIIGHARSGLKERMIYTPTAMNVENGYKNG